MVVCNFMTRFYPHPFNYLPHEVLWSNWYYFKGEFCRWKYDPEWDISRKKQLELI